MWRTAQDSDNSEDEDFSDDESLYEQEGMDGHRRLEENHAEVDRPALSLLVETGASPALLISQGFWFLWLKIEFLVCQSISSYIISDAMLVIMFAGGVVI